MGTKTQLIVCDNEDERLQILPEISMFFVNRDVHIMQSLHEQEQHLDVLIRQIRRKPKHLLAHIQRIYLSYHQQNSDELYAALIDFLIVLNHQGHAISRRMVFGTQSLLTEKQMLVLKRAIDDETINILLLPGNQFSVLSLGLVGCVDLVERFDEVGSPDSDPLQLAQDAIEYSQLDEAINILERAIKASPDDFSLQQLLLELYRSTDNRTRFEEMTNEFKVLGLELPQAWQSLQDYFYEH